MTCCCDVSVKKPWLLVTLAHCCLQMLQPFWTQTCQLLRPQHPGMLWMHSLLTLLSQPILVWVARRCLSLSTLKKAGLGLGVALQCPCMTGQRNMRHLAA